MKIEPEQFLTSSLTKAPIGLQVCRILAAAIDAVNPYSAVIKNIVRSGNTLEINRQLINLDTFNRILVIGAGKASVPMGIAVCEQLSTYFTKGIILTKDGYGDIPAGSSCPTELQLIEAGHPLPDSRGLAGTHQIIDLLSTTNEKDLIIFLISGGGSALLTSPVDGISLDDLNQAISLLLACGATIQEINCVRKHLDLVKGGQLARIASHSSIVTLVFSDVIGDPLDIIASGPTVPYSSTYLDAMLILTELNLVESLPQSIISHLRAGAEDLIPETPKIDDPLFHNVDNYIIGSNRQAADAAIVQAHQEGFNTMILTNFLQGEARHVGKVIASIARQAAVLNEPLPRPACIVLGGETTVTLTGDGAGGRNQEMALGAVDILSGLDRTIIVTLATDGGDGPTDAAGAVVTGETCAEARGQGMHAASFLTGNNAYNFFAPLDDLIKTGPTQTNVNDLALIFTY